MWLNVNTLILLATAIYLAYKYFTRSFGYWKKKGVPYIKPKLFIGNFYDAFMFKKNIGHMLSDMYTQMTQPFFGIWIFNTPHLIVKSPELIKKILVKDFKHFDNRTVASDEKADKMSANLLFFVKNPEWKQIRSKMTPAFTSGKIKAMIPFMNQAGEDLVHYLTKKVPDGRSIEAKEVFAKYATDLLTSCAFGVEAHSFENEDAPFRNVGREIFDLNFKNGIRGLAYFFVPSMVHLFKIKFVPEYITDFLRKAFWQAIEHRENNKFERNDVIDLIIKLKNENNINGVKFEGDKVVAQAIQFFLAGFETTSSTMAFTLYELCLNKQIQHKLKEEVKSAIKEYGGVTYEAIQSMKYLHKVVSETLRKYPVLPFLDRRCASDYQIPGTDIVLEKGTPVYIPMVGLHYDPDYFPDPEKYDPERFSEENINSRPTHAYIPFGSGPHNCIGERLGLIATKLGIVHVVSNFEVEKSEDTPVPLKYAAKSFVLAAEDGLPMRFINSKRRVSMAA